MTGTKTGGARLRPGNRLRRRSEFTQCQNNGRRFATKRFVLLHLANEAGAVRLGVVVTRKTGGAVIRNRWKRVIRDLFRRERELLPPGGDEVVIVKSSVRGKPDPAARDELRALFSKASER
ncbi:MAG: ribonuclease P protein component [Pseudomonadota bacterium]